MSYGVNILVTAASMRDFSMGTRPLVCQWRGQPGFPKVLGDCPRRISILKKYQEKSNGNPGTGRTERFVSFS
jgi:hypothetical protein